MDAFTSIVFLVITDLLFLYSLVTQNVYALHKDKNNQQQLIFLRKVESMQLYSSFSL